MTEAITVEEYLKMFPGGLVRFASGFSSTQDVDWYEMLYEEEVCEGCGEFWNFKGNDRMTQLKSIYGNCGLCGAGQCILHVDGLFRAVRAMIAMTA